MSGQAHKPQAEPEAKADRINALSVVVNAAMRTR